MQAPTISSPTYTRQAPREGVTAASIVKAGLLAGIAAGMMMAMWQMAVGAIGSELTAVARIDSSFRTPVTSITSVIFGLDAFHGSFHLWPALAGVAGHI